MKISRGEVRELARALTQVGKVEFNPHDNVAQFQRFRYAVGRNFDKAVSIDKQTSTLMSKLQTELAPIPGFTAYLEQRDVELRELAEKDEKGNPLLERNGEDLFYAMSEANKLKLPQLEQQLREEYAAAIAAQQAREDKINAVLQELVDVEFFMIEFQAVPLNLFSGWFSMISPMLRNIPAEFDASRSAMVPRADTTFDMRVIPAPEFEPDPSTKASSPKSDSAVPQNQAT